MRSAEQQTRSGRSAKRSLRSSSAAARWGQARRQPAPSFASCDRRPRGRSGRRLGKPRSPSSASGDPCRSRFDRRGAPLHAESIGPRTRALAALFRSGAAYARNASISARSPACARLDGRRRLCWPLRTATRTRFASARPRLASTAPRPRLEARRRCSRERARPPRCVERIPCHPLFKDQHPSLRSVTGSGSPLRGECRVSRRFTRFGPTCPNLPVRCSLPTGVWGAEPLVSVTESEPNEPQRVRARQLLDRERFHRRFVEKSRFPRSEDLPSPGGQGRSREREGCKPGRRRSRHPFARPRLRREELARPAVSTAATAVARRTDDA